MKKQTLVVLALCVAALLYFGFGRAQVQPAATTLDAADTVKHATPDAHASAAGALQKQEPAATQAAVPAPAGALSVDERETLVMYDEMRAAFDQHRSNCLRMGEVVEFAVEAHTDALTRLRDERDSMSPAEQAAAVQRIEAAEGPRLKELRSAMEQAVAKCKHETVLMNALRKLGTLNAPRGAEPTH